jgi:hypothetical protein
MTDTVKIRLVLVAAVVSIGFVLVTGESETSDEALTTPTQNGEVQGQTLEVRDAVGDPEPLQDNLQSPRANTSQEAAGQLQIPRTVDELQPNARTLELPE